MADYPLELSFPLKEAWSFWYLDAEKNKDWMERLHNVCTLESAEQFWAYVLTTLFLCLVCLL